MNSMTEIKGGDIALLPAALTPAIVFAPGGVDDLLAKVRAAVAAVPKDISTKENRAAIRSAAYSVARSKTALDDMGKELTAELKAKTGAIDAERRRIRQELDALAEQVRKPLTDWEEAEKTRVANHEAAISGIVRLGAFDVAEPPIADIKSRIVELSGITRDWQEFAARAAEAINKTGASLRALLDLREMQEAERAELARLRAEEDARKQAEREAEIARRAAEQARLDAERRAAEEAKRAADLAAAERKRIQDAAEAAARAAEAARLQAESERKQAEERAAKAERDRIEAQQKAAADAKAAADKAAADRAAAIEAERQRIAAEQKRQADEQAARERDKAHKAKINGEVCAALEQVGMPADLAKAAVIAIAKGQVPHTKISY